MSRAHYCIDQGCPNFAKWFIAETGMTPETFVNKWNKKLGNGLCSKTRR